MRALNSAEVCLVSGGDNPGLGPYQDGFYFNFYNTDDPSTSYVSAGWGDGSAPITMSLAEIGASWATLGLGIHGLAAKLLGKEITKNASDADYTGSLMAMEGFSISPWGDVRRGDAVILT